MKAGALALCLGLAGLFLAEPAHAQARVWVVDDDGGADFTTIQAAVDAAFDGEIVLVRDGSYDGYTIDGKSLVVSGELGATVAIMGSTTIRNLGSTQSVLLRGLSGVQGFQVAGSGNVLDSQGPVWIEDCRFKPSTIYPGELSPIFQVRNCAGVTFLRSRLDSPFGQFPTLGAPLGSPGLIVSSSAVHLYDTEVIGAAIYLQLTSGHVGGPGLMLEDSVLFGSGSLFQGGVGHPGSVRITSRPCDDGGQGGTGAILGEGARLFWLDGGLVGGVGGPPGEGTDPPCFEGPAGADWTAAGGELTTLSGSARRIVSNSPVREGETWNVVLASEPGDLAILAMATRHLPLGYYAPWKGAILNLLPVSVSVLGVVPAEGFLGTSGTVEDVYAPGEGLPLLFQGVVLTPGGELVLTPGTMQLQLDASL